MDIACAAKLIGAPFFCLRIAARRVPDSMRFLVSGSRSCGKLHEGFQLAELRQFKLYLAGDLLHRLGLGSRAYA